jgi:hypothetical protein
MTTEDEIDELIDQINASSTEGAVLGSLGDLETIIKAHPEFSARHPNLRVRNNKCRDSRLIVQLLLSELTLGCRFTICASLQISQQ